MSVDCVDCVMRKSVGSISALVLPVLSANLYWMPVRLGKRISIVPTKRAKAYREEVAYLAKQAGIRKPLTGRIDLTIRYYPNRPQDWAKRARKDPDNWADTVQSIDLGNCEKVLSDALNKVAWVDDKQIHRIELIKMEPDEHGSRCVVEFFEIVRPKIAELML
jgi:crossover junction endodeoxyribonuclease RusA